MAKSEIPKDKTAYVIIGLFALIAFFVIKGMWKGTHATTVQMEEDVLYIKPQAKI
jgi:hypothetical protein